MLTILLTFLKTTERCFYDAITQITGENICTIPTETLLIFVMVLHMQHHMDKITD